MQVNEIQSLATTCKTDNQAADLMFLMIDEFTTPKMAGLEVLNRDGYIENDGACHCQVSFSYEISKKFLLSIIPEIREGAFAVVIQVDLAWDGLGLNSQHTEAVGELVHVMDKFEGTETLAAIADDAVAKALSFHAQLIQYAGLSEKDAEMHANLLWPKA